MKTAIINGKEMNGKQLFDAVKNLRARDLIERYLIPNGIKYNGSKTSLKESKQAVIDRMLKHFGLDEEPVERQVEAVRSDVLGTYGALEVNMSDTPNRLGLIDRLETLSKEYPEFRAVLVSEDEWCVGDLYDIFRGDKYVASILPCADKVFVTSPADSVGYNAVSIKYDDIDTWFAEIIKD